MAIIHIADVASAQRLHHVRDLTRAARRHEQMHMIGRQYISVDGAAFAQRDLAQVVAVALVVCGNEEAGLPVVAALDDMLRYVRQIEARAARHDGI